MMNNKVKIISIITILTLTIMLGLIVYLPSNETIKDKTQNNCNHIDLNIDMICDNCKSNLPFDKFMKHQNLEATSEDNTVAKISGNMPQNTNAKITNINKEKAINLIQNKVNLNKDDVIGAYNISLNTNQNTSSIKYQPGNYNKSVKVELSNVNVDLDKHYAMLHILDNNEHEIIPVKKINRNKISFDATSFSTYILITVEGHNLSFTGENYKVYNMLGNEITDGTVIESGTNFAFTIVPNDGYGITNVTCSNLAQADMFKVTGDVNLKSGTITAITQDLTLDITTVAAPKIITEPTSTKAKIGGTASFSVEAQNVTSYQWQFRDVGKSGWTNVDNNGTSANVTVNVTEDTSGREFRCLLGNDNFTGNEMLATDIVALFVADDEITLNVIATSADTVLPVITASPESQKIKLGETATFTIEAENVVNYKWQYKTSNDQETWLDVDEKLGTSIALASGFDTKTLTIDTSSLSLDENSLEIAEDLSNYVFRCALTNENSSTIYKKSDAVFLSIAQDDILIDNIMFGAYKIESTSMIYDTLQSAIADAVSGDKIIVINNVDDDSTATFNKNLTLDTNGFTITKTTTKITVNSGCTLNVIGEGSIIGTMNTRLIENSGTFNLTDATLQTTGTTSSCYAIYNNKGIVTINSGLVRANVRAVYNLGIFNIKGGTLAVEGSLSQNYFVILDESYKELNITGGEIICRNTSASNDAKAIELKGGNILFENAKIIAESNDVASGIQFYSGNKTGSLTINSGTIETYGKNNSRGLRTNSSSTIDIDIIVKGGTIIAGTEGDGIAIDSNLNTGNIEILGGTISATQYGIYSDEHLTSLTVGDIDKELNKTNPTISGGEYGVYVPKEFTFNNGIIKGTAEKPYYIDAKTEQIAHTIEVSGPEEGIYSAYLVLDDSVSLITEWTIPVDVDGVQATTGSPQTTIRLPIPSVSNNEYFVEWGDGTADKYTTEAFPTHTYKNTTEKIYTIKIGGKVNQFGYIETDEVTSSGANSDYYTFTQYVTALKGWGELGATRYGFAQCINLAGTIPSPTENSFKAITDMSNLFYNCGVLNGTIPVDFFKQATEVQSFEGTFSGCKGLNGNISADLFANNTKVTSFKETFKDCILLSGSLSATLFSNNKEVTDFTGTFENCSTLNETIPVGLFTENTKVTTFANTFKGCMNLIGTIPSSLFAANNLVEDFSNTFNGCSKLSGLVPAQLFINNTKASNFTGTFEGCSSITACELQVSTDVVTQMDNLFKDCTALESVVFSKDFKNLTGKDMFLNAGALRAIILLQQAETEAEIGTISNMEELGLTEATVIYVPYEEHEELHEKVWTNIPKDNIQMIVQIVPPNPDYVGLHGTYNDPGYTVAGFSMDEATKYTQYGFYVDVKGTPVDTSKLGSNWIRYILKRD